MKNRLYLIILILVVLFLLVIEYFPYGTKKYKIDNIYIEIPKMTWIVDKKEDRIILKTLRNSSSINKDIKKILKKYKLRKENNKIFYYDIKQEYYIEEYKVKKGFFTSEIIIKLDR